MLTENRGENSRDWVKINLDMIKNPTDWVAFVRGEGDVHAKPTQGGRKLAKVEALAGDNIVVRYTNGSSEEIFYGYNNEDSRVSLYYRHEDDLGRRLDKSRGQSWAPWIKHGRAGMWQMANFSGLTISEFKDQYCELYGEYPEN
ncbi:MAG: hypothetical protein M1165_02310 [Candidatus Pacearchaeota archaeon]|nr:hypothetical protein [Candidatus Pacearchaeota archaeon]